MEEPGGGNPGLSAAHRPVLPGPEGSRRPEVEAALRHLQLCLDVGLPGRSQPNPQITRSLSSQVKLPSFPSWALLGVSGGEE